MGKIIKKTKGITLIELVITIVVLLILACISIKMMLGENEIGTKMKEKKLNKQNDTLTETKTLVEAFNAGELNIGDYIEYKTIAGQTYTSVTNENGWADQTYTVDTTTTWRVLGLSDEGNQVLLTSGSPIKKDMNVSSENDWDKDPYLYMKGAYSYVNCEKMLNDICAIYSTDLGTARSMTIEDINKACGVKVENNTVYLESDPSFNIAQTGVLGQTYTYNTETDYTPASYIDGKKHVTADEEPATGTAYWYDITSMMSKTIGNGNVTLGNLLFDKTTGNDNYAKAYWLASPGVGVYPSNATFGSGGVGFNAGPGHAFYSDGFWRANRHAVRPVVTLRPDVTTEQVKKLKNQNITEDAWIEYEANWNASGDASTGEAGNHGN